MPYMIVTAIIAIFVAILALQNSMMGPEAESRRYVEEPQDE